MTSCLNIALLRISLSTARSIYFLGVGSLFRVKGGHPPVFTITGVTFADSYLRANIEFRNKACTRGKYYSYTKLYFVLFVFIYVYSHMYVRHVLAVALASLP